LTFGTYKEYIKDMPNGVGGIMSKHSFKFEDIAEIKKVSQLPVVIKGILCKEDALEAIKNGADAIWVSNDAGKNLDSAPSTISVLKSIVKAVRTQSVKKDAEIYFDGGLRRGTDIIKALAFGANFVFLGRPVMWALH
jgi:(S)-2-hydroxy-acid oxidase